MISLIVFFMVLITPAFSQSTFVREKQVPNYYIPKSELDRQEVIVEKKRPFKQIVQKEITAMIQHPEYQKIFDEYLVDAQYISDTGQYPDTKQIFEDLEGMDTNEKFLVQ